MQPLTDPNVNPAPADFRPDIVDALKADLDPARVKTRSQSGTSLSYLEGYDVIDTLNRIFGFGGWDMFVRDIAFQAEAGPNGGYRATVEICTMGDKTGASVCRADVGFGIVQGKDTARPEAYEMAVKTAVTDAMKRAARTFGAQFGNSLYDKDSPLHQGNQGPARSAGGFGGQASGGFGGFRTR